MHVFLLFIAGLVLWKILHPTVKPAREKFVCRHCGTCDIPVIKSPRTLWIEIILWFSYLIPGVLYTLWCYHATHTVCARCGSEDIVPLDSPVGRKLGGATAQDATPMSQGRL